MNFVIGSSKMPSAIFNGPDMIWWLHRMFRAGDNFILKALVQSCKVGTKSSYPHSKILVVFRCFLGRLEFIAGDHIKLNMRAAHVHVRLDERDEIPCPGYSIEGVRVKLYIKVIGSVIHGIQRLCRRADEGQRPFLSVPGVADTLPSVSGRPFLRPEGSAPVSIPK